jgi:TetR/AcrR family transcriptional repressor of nem operon
MPKAKQFDEAEVLKAAQQVFCEKGYNGTSMDDLVQATGLSRSSIYDTFGDKHGLFLKTLNQYCTSEMGDMEQLLSKTDSPRKKIRLIFDDLVKKILTDKEQKGCLLINVTMEMSCVDKTVSTMAMDNMEGIEQLFQSLVKEGQASGEIARKFPPRVLSRHLYNSLMGLRVTGKNRPEADALKEVVKVALSILDE